MAHIESTVGPAFAGQGISTSSFQRVVPKSGGVLMTPCQSVKRRPLRIEMNGESGTTKCKPPQIFSFFVPLASALKSRRDVSSDRPCGARDIGSYAFRIVPKRLSIKLALHPDPPRGSNKFHSCVTSFSLRRGLTTAGSTTVDESSRPSFHDQDPADVLISYGFRYSLFGSRRGEGTAGRAPTT